MAVGNITDAAIEHRRTQGTEVEGIDAVLHCAARSLVGESVAGAGVPSSIGPGLAVRVSAGAMLPPPFTSKLTLLRSIFC